MYGTAVELARILKIRTPSAEQTTALTRVLTAAMVEIDAELDRADDAVALTADQLELVVEVALERAAELWREQEVQFGVVGIGSEFGGTHIARDTWARYAIKLAPLKGQWGFA